MIQYLQYCEESNQKNLCKDYFACLSSHHERACRPPRQRQRQYKAPMFVTFENHMKQKKKTMGIAVPGADSDVAIKGDDTRVFMVLRRKPQQ